MVAGGAHTIVCADETMVNGVLGSGPAPAFAPPYVPVGPVAGGTASSPRGMLLQGTIVR
jgi:hypothetical protein